MFADGEAFVAFDTSKEKNAVAIKAGDRTGEVRYLGGIGNTPEATRKLVTKLAAKYGRLHFCYEAGRPATGFTADRGTRSSPAWVADPTHEAIRELTRDARRRWKICVASASWSAPFCSVTAGASPASPAGAVGTLVGCPPAGWHLIGDRFVLLDGGTIGRVIDPMAWRNTALHYKAVSAGLAIAAAADTVFTDTGASLNPSATVRMKLGAVTPVGT
jgi:hypothetical protein